MITDVTKLLELDGWTNATGKTVAIEIAYRADRKGIVRMPLTEIALNCGTTLRTVKRHVSELYEAGVLERVGHGRYEWRRSAFTEDEGEDGRPATEIWWQHG